MELIEIGVVSEDTFGLPVNFESDIENPVNGTFE